MNHENRSDGSVDVVGLGLLGVVGFDGEGSTRDLEQWSLSSVGSVSEVLLELERVEGGGHDDDLEVFTTSGDLKKKEKVGEGRRER